MIKSRGLNHINLNVSDIQRSLRFYQAAFGLEVRFWDGRRMVFLGSPGGNDTITLCEVDTDQPIGAGGVSHFGFALAGQDQFEESVRQVERAGGRLLSRGDHAPGLPYAYFTDPDGYVIELGSS
ncbi:VOC family protein [Pseudomonas cavernicola]|uniref:VOC family protein n=1 Tax=Pseudomonas cavernicola TaxID=2320866 RepID=A0A418X8Q2_9PSED|nr:VOC family protein [Pseudomonas cavernicola]RJG08854.1 VOC family protein [Pseudomonas cavernicola]